MNITNTFIRVSTDCPVDQSVVPISNKESKPVHVIQFELLTENPYVYTLNDLIYEVHIRHKQIPASELEARGDEIRTELFQKNHPCLRTSMLAKKYGWGVHYNDEGKIAIYPMESKEYQQFIDTDDRFDGIKLVYAMRSSRG